MTGDGERNLDECGTYSSPSALIIDSFAGELIDGILDVFVLELVKFGSELKNQAPDFFHI
jgi:hypothetical protein